MVHFDDGVPARRAFRRSPATLLVLCGGLAVALLLAGRIWWIPAHVSIDPNEGWNAFHALAAMRGQRLYPPPGGLTGDNYPPLSFYLVGVVARVTGDAIVAGRIVSLAALLAVAAGVMGAVRRLSPARGWAPALGALLFLAYNATAYRRYVAIDDPQWLGHAFMTGGLLMLLSRDVADGRRWRIAFAALLMVCGGLTKHNLVAFPIGATLWLAACDRRGLAIWLAAGTTFGGIAVIACLSAYGPDVLRDIAGSPRTYSAARMIQKGGLAALVLLPLVVVATPMWRARCRSGPRLLVLLVAAVALPLGIVQRSGAGVDVNAHFEALIALCILAPVGLAMIDRAWLRRAGLALVAVPVAAIVPAAAAMDIGELSGRDAAVAATRPILGEIAAVNGPAACQSQALCYWGGKDFVLDFFLMGQVTVSGGDIGPLRTALAAHRFAAIELDTDPRRTNPISTFVRAQYRPVYDDGDHQLLVPQ